MSKPVPRLGIQGDYTRKPCAVCGAPKPPGKGRRICDKESCRATLDTGRVARDRGNNTARAARRRAGESTPKVIPPHAPGKKWCPKCQRLRAESTFPLRTERNGYKGLGAYCKPCTKAYNRELRLQRVYGITQEQYDAIKVVQGGRCAICQRATGASRALAVDHNHDTGEVRGLLCSLCNYKVLGHLREDPAALQRAIDYLRDPPARKVLST